MCLDVLGYRLGGGFQVGVCGLVSELKSLFVPELARDCIKSLVFLVHQFVDGVLNLFRGAEAEFGADGGFLAVFKA